VEQVSHFRIYHWNGWIPQSIHNANCIKIGLSTITHESLEGWIQYPYFLPWSYSNNAKNERTFGTLNLHIIENNGHDFAINEVIDMTNDWFSMISSSSHDQTWQITSQDRCLVESVMQGWLHFLVHL